MKKKLRLANYSQKKISSQFFIFQIESRMQKSTLIIFFSDVFNVELNRMWRALKMHPGNISIYILIIGKYFTTSFQFNICLFKTVDSD